MSGRVLVIDLREQEEIFTGNRFTAYTLFPECNVSVQVIWGKAKQNVVLTVGKSIFDRTNPVDIGRLMAEIISGLAGVAYSARVAVNTVANLAKAKKALRRAFETQINGEGFGFVEFLATCPTNWKMTPVAANERIAKAMIPEYPLGVYKDVADIKE